MENPAAANSEVASSSSNGPSTSSATTTDTTTKPKAAPLPKFSRCSSDIDLDESEDEETKEEKRSQAEMKKIMETRSKEEAEKQKFEMERARWMEEQMKRKAMADANREPESESEEEIEEEKPEPPEVIEERKRKEAEEAEKQRVKDEERAREEVRRKEVLARIQVKKDIVFSDLFDLGLARQAVGCVLTCTIMERNNDHWPNSKQIRVVDSANDARSVFFYTDEPEPHFSLDDLKDGNIIVFRDPNLHFFMDGQMGLRIEEAHLVSVRPNPDFGPAERLRFALAEKEDGARWYTQKKYDESIGRYDSALRHAEYVPSTDPAFGRRRANIETLCYSNISACFFQKKQWDDVIKFAKKALALDPKLAKSYFRIAQAQVHNRQYELARDNYKKALELAPTDKAIHDGIKELNELTKERNEAEHALWKGLLANKNKDGSKSDSQNSTSPSPPPPPASTSTSTPASKPTTSSATTSSSKPSSAKITEISDDESDADKTKKDATPKKQVTVTDPTPNGGQKPADTSAAPPSKPKPSPPPAPKPAVKPSVPKQQPLAQVAPKKASGATQVKEEGRMDLFKQLMQDIRWDWVLYVAGALTVLLVGVAIGMILAISASAKTTAKL